MTFTDAQIARYRANENFWPELQVRDEPIRPGDILISENDDHIEIRTMIFIDAIAPDERPTVHRDPSQGYFFRFSEAKFATSFAAKFKSQLPQAEKPKAVKVEIGDDQGDA